MISAYTSSWLRWDIDNTLVFCSCLVTVFVWFYTDHDGASRTADTCISHVSTTTTTLKEMRCNKKAAKEKQGHMSNL